MDKFNGELSFDQFSPSQIANDFLYGIEPSGGAMRVEALSANTAVLTCLGNDIGYDLIYSHQLKVKAQKNDILLF